jgi:hypothetical protein
LLLFLLWLPISLPAGLYQIHNLSEQQLQQTYLQMLRDASQYAERNWTNSAFDPAASYWGDGASRGNQGIRTIASMVLACGTLLKYDDGLSRAERGDLLAKSTAALRFVVATHVTGSQRCPDGNHWGATDQFGPESWQSGMWTGTLLCGAWLIWDKLDPSLQQSLERVTASEDDILAARKPPTNLWLDTKAEENAWEVPCLVLGELMFPAHPHAAAWHEAALKYMMNTLCTANDAQDTRLVDGRPVNRWVGGANLQPDFTLENHNIFHPSYVGCSSYFLTQATMYYTYAGRPIPQAATHHLLDTWRMFQKIILPWGETAYPQGMDWELHGLPFINLYAALATHARDTLAAHVEQSSLQYLRAWQKLDRGSLTFPGSRLGITRHAINAEQIAYAFLAHAVFGPSAKPMSARAAATQEAGVWEFPYVDFIEHRTQSKFASFSWKNSIMGLLMPIAAGHENNPDLTVPIAHGLVGSFELAPHGDTRTTVVEHSWTRTADGFETSGTLLLNGGRLKQTLRLLSVGKQTVVYEDRVIALTNVTVQSERGVPLGIENDEITGGARVIFDESRQFKLDWQKPRPPFGVSGKWANVDSRLGIVMVIGSGVAYVQASKYSPGIAVYSDVLYGSYFDRSQQFKRGEQVAHRIAVLFVEVTPKETEALAKSLRIETKSQRRALRFQQPEGETVEVPLS